MAAFWQAWNIARNALNGPPKPKTRLTDNYIDNAVRGQLSDRVNNVILDRPAKIELGRLNKAKAKSEAQANAAKAYTAETKLPDFETLLREEQYVSF